MNTAAQVAIELGGRKSGSSWVARCPAHEDRTPSLSITDKNGLVLVHCHSGCQQTSVIAALKSRGLWSSDETIHQAHPPRSGTESRNGRPRSAQGNGHAQQQTPVTTADYVRKQLKRDGFLPTCEFAFGEDLRKVRFEHIEREQSIKVGKPEKSFRWEHQATDSVWYSGDGGKPKPLYVNAAFRERDQVTRVIAFEGEGKADALATFDMPAASFRELTADTAPTLAGFDVVIWPDNDETGRKKAIKAAELIGKHARTVRILEPPPDLPVSGDVIDAVAAGWTAEKLEEYLGGTATNLVRPTVSGLLSVREYGKERIEWLVQGQIAAGTVILITGEPGCGKTTYASAVCGAVAYGTPFAGYQTQKRPVLFIDAENPLSVVQERLDRLGIEDGGPFKIWGGWIPGDIPAAFSPVIVEWVRSCEQKPLIIVDSLISFLKGSENDSTEVRTYMNGYRSLANLGATVVLLHHSGKGESSREYRGSSDIKASVDIAYHLANLGGDSSRLNIVRLKAFKSRFTVDPVVDLTYKNGVFEGSASASTFTNYDLLVDLLKRHPGTTAKEFEEIALQKNLGRNKARDFINSGVNSGRIRVDKGNHNTRFHTWIGDSHEAFDSAN